MKTHEWNRQGTRDAGKDVKENRQDAEDAKREEMRDLRFWHFDFGFSVARGCHEVRQRDVSRHCEEARRGNLPYFNNPCETRRAFHHSTSGTCLYSSPKQHIKKNNIPAVPLFPGNDVHKGQVFS